jgi:hypothetical protein
MKILLIASYSDSWPYVPELIENLRSHGCKIDIFDTKTLLLITDSETRALIPKKWRCILRSSSKFASVFRSYGLLFLAWRAIPGYYDAINMHALSHFYITIAPFIKKNCGKFIITVWGSEFLRASSFHKCLQHFLVPYADAISFNNPKIEEKFINKFKTKKTIILRFGFKSLQVIDSMSQSESLQESRARLGIYTDRLIVALGYNAVVQQQHLEMINAAEKLPDESKRKYFFVVPMTYPANEGYLRLIHQSFIRSGLTGKIFSDFMSMEDICRLRRICHIAVNIQKTDSFSASIQEHIYCGAVMIVGDWLPYEILKSNGIQLIRVPTANHITCVLSHLSMENISSYANNQLSRNVIYKLSSWETNIKKWIEAYSQ